MLKRFLSCAAAFCLAASLIPATALATASTNASTDDARALLASETGTCTVTFDPKGGKIGDATTKTDTVSTGDLVTAPTTPTKSGYRFTGWYANPSFEGMPWYNVLNSYVGETVTGNMTLYAKWESDTFVPERDGFNFVNTSTDFFGDKPRGNYSVSGDYFSLLEQLSASRWGSVINGMNETWGGSCFGMCAVVALLYAGKISPDFLQTNAMNTHDLAKPSQSDVVKNAVNYYYLAQMIGDLANGKRYDSTNETKNNENLVKTMLARTDSSPVIVGLDIKSDTRSMGGHAVLAYDIKDTGSNYEIGIWDPSYPSGLDPDNGPGRVNKLTVSKAYTSSKFNAAYDNDTNGYHSFIKYAIPVSSYSSDSNSVQSLISQMARTNGTPNISRTVQLASRAADDPMFEITITDCESIYLTSFDDGTEGWNSFEVQVRNGELETYLNCNPVVEFINELNETSKMRITIPCSELAGVYGIKVARHFADNPDRGLPLLTCRITNLDVNRYITLLHTIPDLTEVTELTLSAWLPDIGPEYTPSIEMKQTYLNCQARFDIGIEDPSATAQGIDSARVVSQYLSHIGNVPWELTPSKLSVKLGSTSGTLLTVDSAPLSPGDDDTTFLRHTEFCMGIPSDDLEVPVLSYDSDYDGVSYEDVTLTGTSLRILSTEDATSQPVVAALSSNARTPQQAQARSVSYDAIGLFNAAGEMERSTSLDKSISFYSLGGTPITQRTGIGTGYIVGNVQAPSREGFLFDGWFTAPNCSAESAWDAASDPINENTVLYAKWQRDPSYAHRVTLKDDDAETVYLVKHGTTITDPPRSSASSGLWSGDLVSISSDVVVEPSESGPLNWSRGMYSVTSSTAGVSCAPNSGVVAGTKVAITAKKPGERVKSVSVIRSDNNAPVQVSTAQSNGSYIFFMPDSHVEVSVEFVAANAHVTMSPITIGETSGGTILANVDGQEGMATSAAQGSKVTLAAEPSEGSKLKSLTATANGKNLFLHRTGENTYMFMMPATAVSVNAVFLTAAQAVKHKVTVPLNTSETHGSFEVNPSEAREGDTVKVSFQPDLGYEIDFDSLSVKREDTGDDVSFTLSGDSTFLTFSMPASNVNVYGSFQEKTYTLGLVATPFTAGTVKMYREVEGDTVAELTGTVAANTVVRLVPQAAAGYRLSSLFYKPTGAAETAIVADANGVYRFTMPPADTVITARFEMEIDPTKPYLQFTDGDNDEPTGSLTLTVGDTRTLGYHVERPESTAEPSVTEQQQLFAVNDVTVAGTDDSTLGHGIYADTRILSSLEEEDGDPKETVTLAVASDNTEVAEVETVELEGITYVRVSTKQAGTAHLTMTCTSDATVQPGTLTLTVRPFTVNADSASTSVLFDADPTHAGKTGMSLHTSGAVTTYKGTDATHFRMDTVGDEAAKAAEGIIKGIKGADESIVHLVDLSLRDAKGDVVSANTFARKITFKMTDEMKRHRQLGHTLFVAYVDPSGNTLERFESIEYDDLTNPTSLSFETTHFSTYVVMAKGVGTEHAVMLHQSDGGDIKASHTSATPGEVVKLTAEPHIGYKLKGMSVMTADNNPVTPFSMVGNEGTFTMPDGDVNVYADFVKEDVVNTQAPQTPQTPQTPTLFPTVNPDPDTVQDPAGRPIYGDNTANDGGAGITNGSDGAQTTSTAYIYGANPAATTTAGASTAGGTSLVKTGDQIAVATIATSIMLSLIFGGIAFSLRHRTRRR